MIEKAINKILRLAKVERLEIGEHLYTDTPLIQVVPPEDKLPVPLVFNNLKSMKSMVEYVGTKTDFSCKDAFLYVASPYAVRFVSDLMPAAGNIRFEYARSECHFTGFNFGKWIMLEEFIIALQSLFVVSDESSGLISMLGSLANERIIENKDDGFTQSIQIKTGITTRTQVKITNPMTLIPYRTFREVEQPESVCIFRMQDVGKEKHMSCALFTADGGLWELTAIRNIKTWLREQVGNDIVVI